LQNALSKFYSGISSIDDLDKSLVKSQQNKPTGGSGGKQFLKLSQEDGEWTYGSSNCPAIPDAMYVINSYSFLVGYNAWADPSKNGGKREKLGEVMRPLAEAGAAPDIDHSEKGAVWKECVSWDMMCISGEDEGEELSYTTDSIAGKDAFYKVVDETMNRPSRENCFPVVNLGSSSYLNKTWNKKIRTPEFPIIDWADMENNLLSEGKPSEAAPVKVTTPENDNEETPRRRRRAVA